MEPFNIKIGYGRKEVTLTVLPVPEGYFKIIYYGAILGAVQFEGEDWVLVPADEVVAGGLPLYEPGRNGDKIEIDLSEYTIEQIGREIDVHYDDIT